jgi:HNH endonuclease
MLTQDRIANIFGHPASAKPEEPSEEWAIELGIRDFVAREERRGSEFWSEGPAKRRVSGLMVALENGFINRRSLGYAFQYAKDYTRFRYEFRCPSTLEYHRFEPQHASDLILSAGFRVRRAEACLTPAQRELVRRVCGEDQRVSFALLSQLHWALGKLAIHYNDAWVAEHEEIAAFADPITDLRASGGIVQNRFQMGGYYQEIGAQPLLRVAQGGLCAICRKTLSGRATSLDHVVPQSKNGFKGPGNLVLVHSSCNAQRDRADPDYELLRELRRVNVLLGWDHSSDEDPEDQWRLITEGLARLPMAEDGAAFRHYPATSDVRGLGMTAREWARRKVALERTLKRLAKLQAEPPKELPKPRYRPPPVLAEPDPAPEADWTDLLPAKPSRDDSAMDATWLNAVGVVRKNREMRHLGVQAKGALRAKNRSGGKARQRKSHKRQRG